jgi:hypothetical protein
MLKQQSQSSVLIVGIVKDVSRSIHSDLSRLENIFSDFAKVEFYLVESNSSDNSKFDLIQIRATKKNFDFKSIATDESPRISRTEEMAIARNAYLEYLRGMPESDQPDYVAVSDFNNLNELLSKDALNSCWNQEDWDVCTANQSGHYYDIWALRHKFWSPNDCWLHFNFLLDLGVRQDKAFSAAINSRMIRIPSKNEWIEVDSAFGGFALYKTNTLADVEYKGKLETGEIICEHVPLHGQLKSKGYRIFINPELINFKYTDHSKSVLKRNNFLRFCKHFIFSNFRKKTKE